MATMVERLARFVVEADWDEIATDARRELKIRVLDSLGCGIGALAGEPIRLLRGYLAEMGGNPHATLIGGGKAPTDRAALYNGALVRYLDYNDSFLAPGETCHPSDNLGAVLSACEHEGVSGTQFLTALAVAYQVQCRLSEVAPVRAKGFDHTTQGAYAAAAGVAKALGLEAERTAHAIAISGTAFNALRVTRTGELSHWKGLAYPNAAFAATHAAFLAKQGITGPRQVFEGNKGFMDAIAGRFEIDWEAEGFEAVQRTIVKKYNAEIHSQSTLEGVLALRAEYGFRAADVERIDLEIFDVAYHIIGGGEEGDKHRVRTKEEADHSLPYMVAAAILDGWVGPQQYRAERITAQDVQSLLRKVHVRESAAHSRRFPGEMPVTIRIQLRDGQRLESEQRDYEGFLTRPMSWEKAVEKFDLLSAPYASVELRRDISEAVRTLEGLEIRELTALLAHVGKD